MNPLGLWRGLPISALPEGRRHQNLARGTDVKVHEASSALVRGAIFDPGEPSECEGPFLGEASVLPAGGALFDGSYAGS